MADVPGEFDGPDVEFDEEPPELVEDELPLAPVVPFEVVEASERGESTALELAVVTPPHPQPQRARLMSTKKSRKNGESCGRK
jgi:hypothetical protein